MPQNMEMPKMIFAPFARDKAAEATEDDPSVIPDIKLFAPPPDATPQTLFPPGRNHDYLGVFHDRFVNVNQRHHILIYTDGACLNHGTEKATAGCAFVFRPPGVVHITGVYTEGVTSFRLEDEGPTGKPALQTSNRAELRAVIAALYFRVWYGEGQQKIVIATDSEYVCKGITEWVKTWAKNDWKTSKGTPVANRDLWEALLAELRHYRRNGADVEFWKIPREYNEVADRAAKAAAAKPSQPHYTPILGALI